MPRAEVGTPKWLANKMKAKGLQRLRWYCQMCEKQCRDENGFKCHRMSEAHQRQMQIFMQRPDRYMDDFSSQFEATFMQLMRTRYCRARVLANTVYCDLIADKEHIHMNSTRWSTLSEFVLYLQRSGKCTAEYTDQGWYIEYIDRERIEREKRLDALRKEEVTCEQRREKILKRQIAAAWERSKNDEDARKVIKPFQRTDDEESVKIQLPMIGLPAGVAKDLPTIPPKGFKGLLRQPSSTSQVSSTTSAPSVTKRMTALERLIVEQEERKRQRAPLSSDTALKKLSVGTVSLETPNAKEDMPQDTCSANALNASEGTSTSCEETFQSNDPATLDTEEDEMWISENLVVRVMTKDLCEGKYYRQKGWVKSIKERYVGRIVMIASGDTLLLDQAMLEPVVPGVRGAVEVIRGSFKHKKGHVRDINLSQKTVTVEICNPGYRATQIEQISLMNDMSSDTNAPGDGPSLLFEHAVKFMQGRRTVQEDRHVIIDPLEVYIQQSVPQASQFTFPTSLKPALLMGLFDGHSGAQASTFCVQRLPLEIAKEFSALPWTERVHVPVCSTEVDTAPPEQSKTVPLSIMSPPTINQTVTLAPSLDSTDKGNPEVRLQDCRPSTDASLEGTHQKRLRTDSASETPTTELDKRQKLCESSSSAASTAPCTTISESTFEASEAQSKASITVETIAAAIRRAFITTDRLFLEKYRLNKDGSTASLVIILGPHVFIAWLGDSGVILGSERTLSFHSPTPRSQKTFFPLLSIGIHAEEFSSPQVPPDKALLSRSAAATDGGAIKLWVRQTSGHQRGTCVVYLYIYQMMYHN